MISLMPSAGGETNFVHWSQYFLWEVDFKTNSFLSEACVILSVYPLQVFVEGDVKG